MLDLFPNLLGEGLEEPAFFEQGHMTVMLGNSFSGHGCMKIEGVS